MTAPRASVCVPTINRPDYFREALASLSAQTWRDFEVVVADNSGDPKCQSKIDEVMAEFRHLRFVLIRHPSQLDVVANFNSMIDAAHGEFWTCLPDDDRFCPTFLERSIGALEQQPTCDFTFADHWIIRADGTLDEELSVANSIRYSRTSLRPGVHLHDSLFGLALKQSICLQTAVFRHSMIDTFRFAPGVLTLDHSLFLRIGAESHAVNGCYIDERLMEYRLHAAQYSSTTGRRDFLQAGIAGFESVRHVPTRYLREFKNRLGREYLALAFAEAEAGAGGIARAHARHSLSLSLKWRTVFGAALVNFLPTKAWRLWR